MKRFGKAALVLALVVCGGFLLNESMAQQAPGMAAAQPTRVAVCNLLEVFNANEKSRDMQAMIEQKRAALEGEHQQRAQKLETAARELEALKEGSEQYEKTVQKVQRLSIELKNWVEFQKALVAREQQQFTQQMYSEILAVVEAVAQQQGAQLVINVERGAPEAADTRELISLIERRKVLYAAREIDITDDVLQQLNEAYMAAKDQ